MLERTFRRRKDLIKNDFYDLQIDEYDGDEWLWDMWKSYFKSFKEIGQINKIFKYSSSLKIDFLFFYINSKIINKIKFGFVF